MDKLSEEIFILQQKLKEKEVEVMKIKREYDIKSVNSENIKEIFIADPTKINIELNNELNSLRDIMGKLTKMLNAEKSKNEKLEKKYQQLLEDYEELKENFLNSSNNSENICEKAYKDSYDKDNKQALNEKDTPNRKSDVSKKSINNIATIIMKNIENNKTDKNNCKLNMILN